MPLLELIDKIDNLVSNGSTISVVRGQLLVLREQAEALEEHLRTLESAPVDKALVAERDRLKLLLDEAYEQIERLQAEQHFERQSRERAIQQPKPTPEAIDVTHAEIIHNIKSVDPYHQDQIAETFAGKRVSWIAHLRSITRREGYTSVTAELPEERSYLHCQTDPESCHSLIAAKKDAPMRVGGTIHSVGEFDTFLYDCTFDLLATDGI
jgi:hypothetical protein